MELHQSSEGVSYNGNNYRGFVFAVHENHGMLLLHCTRKRKKQAHFQLPGGHIDDEDFEMAAQQMQPPASRTRKDHLCHAARIGAARELYEETGIDIRSSLDRLEPSPLRPSSTEELTCELKCRLYFFLHLQDSDFPTDGSKSLSSPIGKDDFPLKLALSHEHSGFIFEPDPLQSIEKIKHHSGGYGSQALSMAMKNHG